jgi:hypothetical protein
MKFDGEPEVQYVEPVYDAVLVTDEEPELPPRVPQETVVYLMPVSSYRKPPCCQSCSLIIAGGLFLSCFVITGLITLWVFMAYGETWVYLPTIRNLEYSINADATAILTNNESMGTLALRIGNDNNFDVTFKEPEVRIKLKQGGNVYQLAKYSSSKSLFLSKGENGNIAIDYVNVFNETGVWNLQTECVNKGWAKLKVHGHLKMKGGAHSDWSRQQIRSHFNKCIPCRCNGVLYCGNNNPVIDVDEMHESDCWKTVPTPVDD